MIIQNNVHLASKTTMKIGGYADIFYIPETEEELIQVSQRIYDEKRKLYILSGGSNLLINDERSFDEIVYMGNACQDMIELGDGRFYIGASNRIQKVISFVNDYEYGGFEGLIGLPALFGGIVYMNAGIGGANNSLFTIGDFVEKVKAWDLQSKMLVEIPSDKCEFGHRHSLFHNQRYLILGAFIKCKSINREESKKVIEMRLKHCREKFEYGKGCFGTCFSSVNYRILKVVSFYDRIRKIGKGRVTFGMNNLNWLVNHGGGTYRDAIGIINVCKRMHRLCNQKIKCEIVIWE